MARPRRRCPHRREILFCSCCTVARPRMNAASRSAAARLTSSLFGFLVSYRPLVRTVRTSHVRPPGRTGRSARRAGRSVRVCIQNSAPDQPDWLWQLHRAAKALPRYSATPRSDTTRSCARSGQRSASLGSCTVDIQQASATLVALRCRSDRTRSCARAGQLLQVDERAICASTGHQCHLCRTSRPRS